MPHELSSLPASNHRRGSVLIIAMVVIFAITAMVLALARQARVQALASSNDIAAQKADAAERGAEQFLLSLLTDYRDSLPTMTQTDFQAVPVGDAFFWINRPDYGDDTLPAWGPLDEATKLSLNAASQDSMAALPGMTPELAGAIVDWRDADDTVTTGGAETSAYAGLPEPYAAKNADFETVDELMLVSGFTHDLLYGPPAGSTASTAASGTTSDWSLKHGVAEYFTAWNTSPNTASDGTKRVSFNAAADRTALGQLLADKLGSQARAGEIVNIITPPGPGRRNRPGPPTPIQLADIFDLANRVNLTQDEFAKIEDFVTNDSEVTQLKGRINLNTAPREVLMALSAQVPSFTEADVDKLIARRPDAVTSTPNSLGWVYDEIKADAVGLGTLVCAQGRQFSADIVSASGNGRGFRRVRVVIDTTSSPARIVYRRDLTDRGWPMDPAVLDGLKAGKGVGGYAAAATEGMR